MPAQRSPASLNARLQALKNPRLWGWIVVILLPSLLIADYWQHPEPLNSENRANSDRLVMPNRTGTPPTSIGTLSLPNSTLLPNPAALSTQTDLPIKAASPDAATNQTQRAKTLLSNPASSQPKQPVEPKSGRQATREQNRRDLPPSSPSTLPSTFLSDTFGVRSASTSMPAQPNSLSTRASSTISDPSQPGAAKLSNQLETTFDRIMGQTDPNQTASETNSQTRPTIQPPTNSYSQSTDASGDSSATPSRSFSPASGFQPYSSQRSSSATDSRVPPAFRTTTNTPGFFSNSSSTHSGVHRSPSELRSGSQSTSRRPIQPLSQSGYGTTSDDSDRDADLYRNP